MKLRKRSNNIGIGLSVMILALAGSAPASTVLEAVIDGPSAGTPSLATGFATLVVNDEATQVLYEITYTGLEGVETAAHFHNAPPGQNGPVVFPLTVGSPMNGTWDIGPADLAELLAGNIYVNIHSDLYPAGEIRGNLEFVSVATEAESWSLIKTLFR